MTFSRYAKKVAMLIRGSNLGATLSQYLADRITHTSNVEVLFNTKVTALDIELLLKDGNK
jgi:thioredoxin reductase (NADPH)